MSGEETRAQAWSKTALTVALVAASAAAVVFLIHSLPSAQATEPCGPNWQSSCYNNGGYSFTDGSPRCSSVPAGSACGQYRWIDQTDISPKPKPAYLWTEISTLVPPVPGEDVINGNIERQRYSSGCIPMRANGALADPLIQFRFYGVDYDCVWIQANGLIVLDRTTALVGKPADCPAINPSTQTTDTPPNFCAQPNRFSQKPFPFAGMAGVGPNRPTIAGFWVKDMDPTACFNPPDDANGNPTNGGIYAQAVGPVGARRFIIEWNGIVTYAQGAPQANCPTAGQCQMPPYIRCYWNTFQIVLYEASPLTGDSSTIDVMLQTAQTPEDPQSPTCTPPCPPAPAPVAPACPPGTAGNINCFVIGIYNPGPTNYGLTYAFDYKQAFSQHAVRFYLNHDPTYGTTYLYEDPPVPQGITLAPLDMDGDQPRCEVLALPGNQIGVLDPGLAAPNNTCLRTFMPVQDFCTEWGNYTPVGVPERITDGVLGANNAANSWAWMPNGVANIRVYCVNDAPFAGQGSPPDIIGVQHTPLTYQDWAIGMFPGPFTATDEDSQALTYVLQNALAPGSFTVPPTLTRTPSATSGTTATLTFTAHDIGHYENICWKVRDSGGLSPASPPAFDTSLGTVCVNLTILPYQNDTGGDGVCGTLHPSFTVTGNQVDIGNALTFLSKSTATGSTLVSWHWSFGDGFTDETDRTTHAYTEPGDYAVRLTVVDDGGCASTAMTILHIGEPTDGTPGVIFDPSRQPPFVDAGDDRVVLEGDHVVLHATSSNLEPGDLVTYKWTQLAGPGVVMQKPNTAAPDFIAPTLQDADVPEVLEFSVRATVAQVTSAEDTVKITIATQNQRPPKADAGPDVPDADYGEQLTLAGNGSFDPDGNMLIYAWTHAGGAPVASGLPASGVRPLVTLAAESPEAYTEVLLTVSDGTYTSTDLVRLWMRPEGAPAVGFRATPLKDGVVTFTALSTSASYKWTFGDGETKTTTTPTVTHTYAASGPYEVTLETDDADAQPFKQPVYATAVRGELDPEATPPWVGFALTFAVVAAFAVAAGLVYAWSRKGGSGGKA